MIYIVFFQILERLYVRLQHPGYDVCRDQGHP